MNMHFPRSLNMHFQLAHKPYLGDNINDLVLYLISYPIVHFHILDEIQQGLCRPDLAWFEVKYLLVNELKLALETLYCSAKVRFSSTASSRYSTSRILLMESSFIFYQG